MSNVHLHEFSWINMRENHIVKENHTHAFNLWDSSTRKNVDLLVWLEATRCFFIVTQYKVITSSFSPVSFAGALTGIMFLIALLHLDQQDLKGLDQVSVDGQGGKKWYPGYPRSITVMVLDFLRSVVDKEDWIFS